MLITGHCIDLDVVSMDDVGKCSNQDIFPAGFVVLPDSHDGIVEDLKEMSHLGW